MISYPRTALADELVTALQGRADDERRRAETCQDPKVQNAFSHLYLLF